MESGKSCLLFHWTHIFQRKLPVDSLYESAIDRSHAEMCSLPKCEHLTFSKKCKHYQQAIAMRLCLHVHGVM